MNTIDLKDEKGKSLPKSYVKTLAKLVEQKKIAPSYRDASDPEYRTCERSNPFSGKSVIIPRLAGDLADWITSNNPIKAPFNRSDWDNARYTFAVCWSKAYYDLID